MPNEFRERIEQWIRRLGSTPQYLSDPQAEWNMLFDYPAGSPGRFHAVGESDMVGVTAVIVIGETHKAKFSKLPPREQFDLIWRVREMLLSPDINFKFEGVTRDGEMPISVLLQAQRYEDGLTTMDDFARVVATVFYMQRKLTWTLNRYLLSGGTDEGGEGRFDFQGVGF